MEYDLVPSAEKQAFLAHIIDDPADDLRRLVFADWLEEHGQGQRAAYIRARCALDGKTPEFGGYADAVAQLWDCEYVPAGLELPTGFSFDPNTRVCRKNWGDKYDAMEGGLPSLVTLDMERLDVSEATRLLNVRMAALIKMMPMRGIKLGSYSWANAIALFATTFASKVTRLEICFVTGDDEACPAILALASSPMSRTLAYLDLVLGVPSVATGDALAAAPFEALRRFDDSHPCDTPEVYRRLMSAPWFNRLESLAVPILPGAFGPVTMHWLHTLAVEPSELGSFEPFVRNAELPALRRLLVSVIDMRGEPARRLTELRCGDLVELWLSVVWLRSADLKVILAAPWARRLEVLTIEISGPNVALHKTIDKSPCAKTLRVRRVGSFN